MNSSQAWILSAVFQGDSEMSYGRSSLYSCLKTLHLLSTASKLCCRTLLINPYLRAEWQERVFGYCTASGQVFTTSPYIFTTLSISEIRRGARKTQCLSIACKKELKDVASGRRELGTPTCVRSPYNQTLFWFCYCKVVRQSTCHRKRVFIHMNS